MKYIYKSLLCKIYYYYVHYCFVVLGIKSRALYMLGKYSAIGQYPQPLKYFFFFGF